MNAEAQERNLTEWMDGGWLLVVARFTTNLEGVSWNFFALLHPGKLTWQRKSTPPFEDVSHMKNADFPATHVSFFGGKRSLLGSPNSPLPLDGTPHLGTPLKLNTAGFSSWKRRLPIWRSAFLGSMQQHFEGVTRCKSYLKLPELIFTAEKRGVKPCNLSCDARGDRSSTCAE